MAGLVPAIHVFLWSETVKMWMPGTSPGMTQPEASGVPRMLRSALAVRC
jgi:hypothetical protein